MEYIADTPMQRIHRHYKSRSTLMPTETSKKKIKLIENTSSQSFQSVLEYIYTGRLRLGDKTKNHLLDLQILANKYGLLNLEKSIIDYISGSVLSIENACEFYNFADHYKIDVLKEACNAKIYENPSDFLKSGDIKFLSAEIFGRIVSIYFTILRTFGSQRLLRSTDYNTVHLLLLSSLLIPF